MDYDVIEDFKGCRIQHGQLNQRVYVMKWGQGCGEREISALDVLAREKGYTKIFAKVPESAGQIFLQADFREEAKIPGYFSEGEACLFLGRYLSEERAVIKEAEKIEQVLNLARGKSGEKFKPLNELRLEKAGIEAAEALANLYKKTFLSYPFPIFDPEYICQTMRSHIDYFDIREDEKLIAAASTEKDGETRAVEMTDFATLPEYRGRGMAGSLLARMEKEASASGFRTAYTIARAVSAGMNITFARAGYAYGGTLVNNTWISGRIESMNVWYKRLSPSTSLRASS